MKKEIDIIERELFTLRQMAAELKLNNAKRKFELAIGDILSLAKRYQRKETALEDYELMLSFSKRIFNVITAGMGDLAESTDKDFSRIHKIIAKCIKGIQMQLAAEIAKESAKR